MNKIEFPRIGVDGEHYSKNDVETEYIKSVKTKILGNLSGGSNIGMTPRERVVVEILKRYLEFILLATPEQLFSLTLIADKKYPGIFSNGGKATNFGEKILECFNYDKFRESVLIKHGGRLNVKSCPYCNQHYTLYITKGKRKKTGLLRFQFDHFFSKAKYPFLSMSIYNLIPSCPTCNQSKSGKELPLMFNPYHQEIADLFKFEIKPSIRLLCGGLKPNYVEEIELIPQEIRNKDAVDEYNDALKIKAQYERHKDVAVEAFCRANMKKIYFEWTYPFISKDPALLDRLVHGTYMEQKDIEKRPLTKFYQDIYHQVKDGKI